MALTLTLILVSALMLLTSNYKEDLLLYLFVGVAGAFAEAGAIAFGAWTYSRPGFVGVPYWLPVLWGIAGVFIKRIAAEIHEFLHSRRAG